MAENLGPLLEEIAGNPGTPALQIIEVFFAVDHVPRHRTAGDIAHLVARGAVRLDDEKRLWMAQ